MNPDIAQYEAFAKELMRVCLAEEDPGEVYKWAMGKLMHIGGGGDDDKSVMTWEQSFDFTIAMLDEYERIAQLPESERTTLTWPWTSWNSIIDPLEPGMLAVITAPDGQGKTIYAETIAEHWAMHKAHVVFLHYELNPRLMMQRRLARYASILPREMKAGHLTPAQKGAAKQVNEALSTWDGYITYIHSPGWTMERTVAKLRSLHAEGKCDAVVIDYLEKVASSGTQVKMFPSPFQREADNVEKLKIFAEEYDVPVLEVAQMKKDGKNKSAGDMDRNDMRGAGEKSEKANLVVLLSREKDGEEGYSSIVRAVVDKNTMGPTGTLTQIMQPEYFRVGDIRQETK